MIMTLSIPAATQRKITRDGKLAAEAGEVMADGLDAAAVAMAEDIRRQLVTEELGLTMRHPASGLAASVLGWMLDRSVPLAAVGVPANSPAAAHARIQNTGGTILPKNAKALAIPISAEAKKYTSPRAMQGLDLIPRPGKPSLLVRQLTKRGALKGFELHWVLVSSVTLPGTRWLDRGAENARGVGAGAFGDVVGPWADKW